MIHLLRARLESNGETVVEKHKLEPPENKNFKEETTRTYRGILEGKPTQILKQRLNTFIYNGGIQDVMQFTGLGNIEIMCKQDRIASTEIKLRVEMQNYLSNINNIITSFNSIVHGD